MKWTIRDVQSASLHCCLALLISFQRARAGKLTNASLFPTCTERTHTTKPISFFFFFLSFSKKPVRVKSCEGWDEMIRTGAIVVPAFSPRSERESSFPSCSSRRNSPAKIPRRHPLPLLEILLLSIVKLTN